MTKKNIVKNVVSECGGTSAIANRIGITRQAVYFWKSVPPQYCRTLETMCRFTRYQMRPDVFGPSLNAAVKDAQSRKRAA